MRIWIAAVGLTFVAGCGYYGDSTGGEENRSSWRLDDGLCPGTEGGCAMTTPVAAGVEVAVDADVPCARRRRDSAGRWVSDCDLEALSVSVGGGELRDVSYDADEARIDIRLATLEPGEVSLELLEADDGLFDRITFDVREAAALECGRVGAAGASWDMESLRSDETYTVSSSGADRESNIELGCRLLDAGGAPLFSAAAIQWQIIEGADLATVDDGGLFGEDSASGARVYVRFDARGTIRLEARFGDLTRQLEVVVD
jgi:hypothetical protein